MIFGHASAGASTVDLPVDKRRTCEISAPSARRVVKLTAYLDGGGAGTGSQALRAVLYAADGTLAAESSEVTVLDGQAAGWTDFSFLEGNPEGVAVAAGTVHGGVISGAATNTTRLYYDSGGAGQHITDTYSDGAAAALGAGTAHTQRLSIYATAFKAWTPPDVPDEELALLPFRDAQDALFGAPLKVTLRRAAVEWHGTRIDTRKGAFALARRGSDYEDLVGERIRVQAGRRFADVYVIDVADIISDISLTKRSFMAVAEPSREELAATVRVLA